MWFAGAGEPVWLTLVRSRKRERRLRTPVRATREGQPCAVLLNIIWLVLCGIWMAIAYVLAGIICCILIITIPFGIASFRIANYALWPFGRTIIRRDGRCRIDARKHHLDHLRGHLAGHRTRDHRDCAVHHDHRHPARYRELQNDPDLPHPVGARHRALRLAVRRAGVRAGLTGD